MGITLPSGLSPLTRGNLFLKPASMRGRGPIPAHAGEPRPKSSSARKWRAYPRSRGGTIAALRKAAICAGLSPLTRGNPVCSAYLGRQHGLSPLTRGNPNNIRLDPAKTGPIPAHAGEPVSRSIGGITRRAYPRSRGGTCVKACLMCWGWGLSPLTRGNRRGAAAQSVRAGPIPAHAGEPEPHRGPGRQ